jgi:hypothetical protein
LCNGRSVCGRCEREGAGVEHPLREVLGVGVSRHADVAECTMLEAVLEYFQFWIGNNCESLV